MTRSRIAIIIFLFTAVHLASGQGKKTSSAPDGNGLRCEVSIHSSDLTYGEKNEIKTFIRNLQPIDVTVHSLAVYLSPSYYLGPYDAPSEEAYVGLVNLETKEPLELTPQGQYLSTSVRIAAGGEKSFNVNLSGLRWEKMKSSSIAPLGLKWVAPGKYALYVQIAEGEGTLQNTSNRIAVTVHNENKGPDRRPRR